VTKDFRATRARTQVPSLQFNASALVSVIALRAFARSLHIWHIHLHAVIPDAVWVLRDGALVTVDVPSPTNDDVDIIVRDICRRVTAYIDRRTNDGTLAAPSFDDDCDDARDLAQLVLTDTVTRKPSILDDFPAAAPTKRRLTAHYDGFSLECKPNVAATDRPGLERLLRYGARPAFAHDRVEQLPNDNVSYRLPKAF
jgi:Putative transposase